MQPRRLTPALACLLLPLTLLAQDAPKARELSPKGVKLEFTKGNLAKPKVIASASELDRVLDDGGMLKKEIDFDKEKLVLFAWTGSGQDKLLGKADKEGKTAIFTYVPGQTRDIRRHVHLYAVPKSAEVRIDSITNK